MLFSLLSFRCADYSSSVARVDFDSMSDQILIECMLAGLTSPENFIDQNGNWRDSHISGIHLNSDGKVEQIMWYAVFDRLKIRGTIELWCIPSTVNCISVTENHLEGTLDIEKLPRGIKNFEAGFNRLTGTLRLSAMPPAIITFAVNVNKFAGTVDLSHLPESMELLSVSYNQLTGTLDLSHLPNKLKNLHVQRNSFSGTIELLHFPPNALFFDFSENNFVQDAVTIGLLLDSIWSLCLAGNAISGVVDVNGREVRHANIQI